MNALTQSGPSTTESTTTTTSARALQHIKDVSRKALQSNELEQSIKQSSRLATGLASVGAVVAVVCVYVALRVLVWLTLHMLVWLTLKVSNKIKVKVSMDVVGHIDIVRIVTTAWHASTAASDTMVKGCYYLARLAL